MTELNEKAEIDSTKVDNDDEKELKLKEDPESLNPGTSASTADSPSSSASTNSPSKDRLFEPTVDMMVNDFDDERTLEEEEALAEKEHEDPNIELSDLQKESDMPIEELLALYSIPPPTTTTTSSKKRKRKAEKSSVKKQHKEEEPGDVENVPAESNDEKQQSPSKKEVDENDDVEKTKRPEEPDQDEEPEIEDDDDEDNTTKPEDIDDNDDDTTNFEEDDPSELKNLYADNFDKKGLTRPDDEDEEDLEYMPDDDDDVKKTIMVGSEFQAQIPEGLCHYDDALPYENEDKLLWDPSKVTEGDIENYLYKSQSIISTTTNPQTNGSGNGNSFLNYIPTSGKHLRDDEQALFLLLQCGYNSEEALRRRRINVVSPSETPLFSEEECRNFESGLRLHGKCFYTIQQKVRTRSVGELVQFYYLWKKSERHDAFANKSRLEKKKYNINPCVTDLMEKFLEEHENNGGGTRDLGHRDRSVSPNVHCLLSTDMKRQRHDSTNSNNNEDIKPVSSIKTKDGTEKILDTSSPVHNFSESQMDIEKIDDHE